MARFYVEGLEIEVSDPTFYQTTEETEKFVQQLSEYVNDYSTN